MKGTHQPVSITREPKAPSMEYDNAVAHGFVGTEAEYHNASHGVETTVDDVAELFEGIPKCENAVSDRMIEQAEKEASRITVKYRTHPFLRTMLLLTSAFMLILAIVGGGLIYLVSTEMVSKRVVDNRPCVFKQEGLDLTGTRSYSYHYNELFGFRWTTVDNISERTVMNVPFAGMIVVAIADGGSKTIIRGKGEGGVVILPNADYYTFMVDGSASAVKYSALCE